jgi:hypothetical protein
VVRTYGQEPPPPVHHYHPPVKRPQAAYVPPKKTYAPPPAYTPTKGKVCHQTCDDGPPSATYAPAATPPAYTPPPPAPKTYVQSSMSVPSVGGGDRAVANLQAALTAKGYYDGQQNGLFTQSTMAAMVKYQHDNHLSEGRYTGETANALGITR